MRFGTSGSLRRRISVRARRARVHLILHVLPPNVKSKSLDQAVSETFAPKLLAAHRAARIAALENIDFQGRLGPQHGNHCATLWPIRVR